MPLSPHVSTPYPNQTKFPFPQTHLNPPSPSKIGRYAISPPIDIFLFQIEPPQPISDSDSNNLQISSKIPENTSSKISPIITRTRTQIPTQGQFSFNDIDISFPTRQELGLEVPTKIILPPSPLSPKRRISEISEKNIRISSESERISSRNTRKRSKPRGLKIHHSSHNNNSTQIHSQDLRSNDNPLTPLPSLDSDESLASVPVPKTPQYHPINTPRWGQLEQLEVNVSGKSTTPVPRTSRRLGKSSGWSNELDE